MVRIACLYCQKSPNREAILIHQEKSQLYIGTFPGEWGSVQAVNQVDWSILRPAHHLSTRATRVQPLSKKLVPELELSVEVSLSICRQYLPTSRTSSGSFSICYKQVLEGKIREPLPSTEPLWSVQWMVGPKEYVPKPALGWILDWTPWPPHAWTCKPFPGKIPEPQVPTLEVVTLRAGTLWNPPKWPSCSPCLWR